MTSLNNILWDKLKLCDTTTFNEMLNDVLGMEDTIQITDICFQGDDLKRFTEVLKSKKFCSTLEFHNCQMSTSGAKAIADLISTNTHLRTLKIEQCNIEHEGIRYITRALSANHSIRTIEIVNCNIRDEGAKAISTLLRNNNSIENMDISSNDIGDEGCKVIAEALKYNHCLRKINISYNPIGNSGAESLAEVMHTTQVIVNLLTNQPTISFDVANKITKISHENSMATDYIGRCNELIQLGHLNLYSLKTIGLWLEELRDMITDNTAKSINTKKLQSISSTITNYRNTSFLRKAGVAKYLRVVPKDEEGNDQPEIALPIEIEAHICSQIRFEDIMAGIAPKFAERVGKSNVVCRL